MRRYPIAARTLVIAVAPRQGKPQAVGRWSRSGTAARKPSHIKFTFMRNGHVDVIHTVFARKPAEICDAIWRAVMSTASSPRMSETELVG